MKKSRLTAPDRKWIRASWRREQRQIAYYTIADAENWLRMLRGISVRLKKLPTTLLAHRYEAAGQYLIVKRYCAEMRRIVGTNRASPVSTVGAANHG